MARLAGQLVNRGKDTWLVRVSLGRDQNGKRKYINKTVRGNKKAAQAVLTKLLREKDTGFIVEPSRQTVQELLSEWLRLAAKPRLRPRTFQDYQRLLERYVIPAVGNKRLPTLTPVDVQAIYGSMMQRGLSARTVRYTHTVFRNALGHAVRRRVLSQNPADFVDLPRLERKEMMALSEDEVRRFLSAARSSRYFVFLNLLVATGLRPGEALALQWSDLDFTEPSLSVVRTVSRNASGRVTFAEPKTKRSRRRLPIPESLAALLLDSCNDDYSSPDSLVFPTVAGTLLHPDNFPRQHFKRILQQASVPTCVRLYDLRHTHATLLLAAGVHPKIVSERLGHASITLTLDTYSHVLPTMQKDASNRLEAILYPQQGHETFDVVVN